MAEPRDQGGLEYLVKAGKLQRIPDQDQEADAPSPSPSPPPPTEASNLDPSLQAFAARAILDSVRKHEDEPGAVAGVRLSDIADDVHLEASVLIPLARRLVSAGAIRILESNAFGDLVVTLTSDGRHLLDPEASGELIRRIMAS